MVVTIDDARLDVTHQTIGDLITSCELDQTKKKPRNVGEPIPHPG